MKLEISYRTFPTSFRTFDIERKLSNFSLPIVKVCNFSFIQLHFPMTCQPLRHYLLFAFAEDCLQQLYEECLSVMYIWYFFGKRGHSGRVGKSRIRTNVSTVPHQRYEWAWMFMNFYELRWKWWIFNSWTLFLPTAIKVLIDSLLSKCFYPV